MSCRRCCRRPALLCSCPGRRAWSPCLPLPLLLHPTAPPTLAQPVSLTAIRMRSMPLLPCPRWQDAAVWCSSRESLESSSAQLPASSTRPQPHCLVQIRRSEPSLAVAAGSASAGWQLPQQPTAADCLRSSTPVLMAPQAQPVMPVGKAGTARHGSWPLHGHQLPSAEAAEAAVVAARRQRQQARQAATAESLPPLPGSQPSSELCGPDATPTLSHQWGAAAAQPPLAQPPVTAGRLADAEAMLAANGRAIVTRVPGVSKRCTETCMLLLHSAVLRRVWLSGHICIALTHPHCCMPRCAGLSRGAGGRRPCRQAKPKPKPLGRAAQRPGPCCKRR